MGIFDKLKKAAATGVMRQALKRLDSQRDSITIARQLSVPGEVLESRRTFWTYTFK